MEDQRLFIRFGKWSEDEISRVTWRGLHIKDEIGDAENEIANKFKMPGGFGF